MHKFIGLLQNFRLLTYILIISFLINLGMSIGVEIANGKANELTFYKMLTFAWAFIALVAFRMMYELYSILGDALKIIKKQKDKKMEIIPSPFSSQEPTLHRQDFPDHSEITVGPFDENQIDEMNLLNSLLNRNKKKKGPPN